MKTIIKLIIFVGIVILLIGIPVYKKDNYYDCTGEYWDNLVEWNLCNYFLKENCPFTLISKNIAFTTIGDCLCGKYETSPDSSIGEEVINICDQTTTCNEANLIKEIKENNPGDYTPAFVCTNKERLFPVN